METPKVFAAISAVTGALAQVGIAKDRKTTGGASFSFRGIDDVYNALSGLLARHKLCMLPNVKSVRYEERATKNGGIVTYCFLEMTFTFASGEDGSTFQVSTLGEAMDSSDKATNKAMSAAMKYAALMSFAIPTVGGMVDSEVDSFEKAGRGPAYTPEVPTADPELGKTFAKPQSSQESKLIQALKMVAQAKTQADLTAVGTFWGKNPPDILLSAFEAKDAEIGDA